MKEEIIHGDCLIEMQKIEENSIDLTVTSPPYDNLRTYNGYTFDFEGIAKELYRVTKQGGVVVWVVGDATIKGSETGTSFKQALYFKEIGFNLHDTMIYFREGMPLTHKRYEQHFEYMFILSKGTPKTFNGIKIPSLNAGKKRTLAYKSASAGDSGKLGGKIGKEVTTQDDKLSGNVWKYQIGGGSADNSAFQHPAIFPEKLAEDHILSWSNEGDTVLDPFAGSGTTLKMAKKNNRNYIGIEISQEYIDIINKRLAPQK